MIYIIWLLLDINFCSAIAVKVKFTAYDALKDFISENIFDIAF